MKLTYKRNTGANTPEWLLRLSMDVRSWFEYKEQYTIEELQEFINRHILALYEQGYIRSSVTSFLTEPSGNRKGVAIMRGNTIVQTYYLEP